MVAVSTVGQAHAGRPPPTRVLIPHLGRDSTLGLEAFRRLEFDARTTALIYCWGNGEPLIPLRT
jgi:hypothetical protein